MVFTPVITSPPHSQEAVESETVQFTCTAAAATAQGPIPGIIWWTASDNGTLEAIIVPTENISSIETETLPVTGEVTSVLTLRNIFSSYSGAIVCQARNDHGADSALAMLTVLGEFMHIFIILCLARCVCLQHVRSFYLFAVLVHGGVCF